MKALGTGPGISRSDIPRSDGSRKLAGISPLRRELLRRGGLLAIAPLLAQPLRLLALPQTPASAAAQPEKKLLTVEERVKQIIVEHLGVEEKQVVPDAQLKGDLGADSLDIIELTMGFEEAFELEISDEACGEWKTVADVVRFIQAEVAKKQPAPASH